MRLLTIPFSHYCEKARWAADRAGVAYREEGYLPVQHFLPVRRAGGRTVPVLLDQGQVYSDSTDILRHLDQALPPETKLYPAGEVRVGELEEYFDEKLGPATRLWAYSYLLSDLGRMARLTGGKLGPAQRLLMRPVMVVARPLIRKRYRVTDGARARATVAIEEVFARVDRELSEGAGDYLASGRFTAADLTFASLAGPILAPPEHPLLGSPGGATEGEMGAEIERMRATRAGAHALRMYREHRGVFRGRARRGALARGRPPAPAKQPQTRQGRPPPSLKPRRARRRAASLRSLSERFS